MYLFLRRNSAVCAFVIVFIAAAITLIHTDLTGRFVARDSELSAAVSSHPLGVCPVKPLDEISDAEALAFERSAGSAGVVHTEGLTSPTARALERFGRLVKSVGGDLFLTSAYRPAAYQAHLQAVWNAWMLELKDNVNPACNDLRAEVQQEFQRHGLLETQHPVTVSDHTLGIGFDAAVAVPRGARIHRRRATIDYLARISGIRRPNHFGDPVHFRLIGARPARSILSRALAKG